MNLDEIKDFIIEKTLVTAKKVGDKLPAGTKDGVYHYKENGGWTGGFWVGLNNYCYLLSGDKKFLEYADCSRHRFIDRLYKDPESLDHDVGFLYIPSEYARFKLRGDSEGLKNTLEAANCLYKRYNSKGKFIQAWNIWTPGEEFSENNRGRIIIDSMYNLPLLFYASEVTGDKKYYEAAFNHAETCMNTIVREDGTTYHTYIIDPDTGMKKFGQTFQGYSDESCWSRGQAWALGGFAMAYRLTGNNAFLETAKKTAKVFIDNLEEDFIPMWDFSLKGKKDMPRDASAASIAASGLLELAALLHGDEKEYFKSSAESIVAGLWNTCAAKNGVKSDGLILHCTGFYKYGAEVDENLIFADYYFAEAVARLMGVEPIL